MAIQTSLEPSCIYVVLKKLSFGPEKLLGIPNLYVRFYVHYVQLQLFMQEVLHIHYVVVPKKPSFLSFRLRVL